MEAGRATEAELAAVARAAGGDRGALEAIVSEHARPVYATVLGFVPPAEADDVAQEAFLRVVQGLATFDGRARLGTWIVRVAVNTALNHLRARRRRPPPAPLPDEALVPSPAPAPGALLDEAEERAAYLRALDALPDEQRAVVVLRVQRGLSFEEVAAALGIARPTAESRMARAKARLRELLAPLVERDAEPEPGPRRSR
ncbi:MAG TPA: sigma-70 family RNA polymerase sigma factor [Planctomycetota bacterium]|nr:sigma-70 family RNA polymerase sigma factor [Planctomycetota bacterium]